MASKSIANSAFGLMGYWKEPIWTRGITVKYTSTSEVPTLSHTWRLKKIPSRGASRIGHHRKYPPPRALSTILMASVANLSRFVTLTYLSYLSLHIIYEWIIIIMGDSRLELSAINIWYSLKTLSYYTPTPSITATSLLWPLSSVPKVVIMERFDCNCLCGIVCG